MDAIFVRGQGDFCYCIENACPSYGGTITVVVIVLQLTFPQGNCDSQEARHYTGPSKLSVAGSMRAAAPGCATAFVLTGIGVAASDCRLVYLA